MKKTLIVGTVAYDEIETPTESSGKILGGAGTYIGLSASLFDTQSSIISIVGGDFEKENLEMLNSKGINTDSIEIVPKGKTFYWKGKSHKDWNKRDTLSTQLNVLADFNPIVKDENINAEIIVLGNLHPLVQNTVLDQVAAVDKRSRTTEQEIRSSIRTSENDIRTLIQHAEDRFDGKRTAIESDAQRRAEALDVKLKELEDRLRDMLEKALNNPLAGK